MSKKKDTGQKASRAPAGAPQGGIAADLPVNIHAQYIRDLSFENPNAPEALRGGQPLPEMDISIGMDARDLPMEGVKHGYEVALNVKATAKRGEKIVFIAELQYGVTLSVGDNVPKETHHPLLFIEIPRLAFPFARQILSDLTVQGGYPPLLLNPVDFYQLYQQRFAKEIAAANAAKKS